MEEHIKIIQAHIEHVDKIVDLYGGYRVFYGREKDVEKEKTFIKQRIENNESVIFLAVDDDGSAMGFIQLYPLFSSVAMRRIWLLNDLYVDKEYRKRGVASALLDRAIEFGKSTGALNVFLETGMENKEAQKLYEKQGWEQDTEHFIYFHPCE